MVDRAKLKEQLLELINQNRKRVPKDILARAEKLALEELERQKEQDKAVSIAMQAEGVTKALSTVDSQKDTAASKGKKPEINMRNFPKINLTDLIGNKDTTLFGDRIIIDREGIEVVEYNRQAAAEAITKFIENIDDKKGFLDRLKKALKTDD